MPDEPLPNLLRHYLGVFGIGEPDIMERVNAFFYTARCLTFIRADLRRLHDRICREPDGPTLRSMAADVEGSGTMEQALEQLEGAARDVAEGIIALRRTTAAARLFNMQTDRDIEEVKQSYASKNEPPSSPENPPAEPGPALE